jgi:hypothetical protein
MRTYFIIGRYSRAYDLSKIMALLYFAFSGGNECPHSSPFRSTLSPTPAKFKNAITPSRHTWPSGRGSEQAQALNIGYSTVPPLAAEFREKGMPGIRGAGPTPTKKRK